jgi:hypothetical protein
VAERIFKGARRPHLQSDPCYASLFHPLCPRQQNGAGVTIYRMVAT